MAGIGDLILTCTGELSRNRTVGLAIGAGLSSDEVLAGMHNVVEGIRTTRAAVELAERHEVQMPIVVPSTRSCTRMWRRPGRSVA